MPRSGTSVAARVLQEQAGVLLDLGPIKKDPMNPLGYYEDEELKKINQIRIKSWAFGKTKVGHIDMEWLIKFKKWAATRKSLFPKWGFKDPRMAAFLDVALKLFKSPTILWTQRTREQIVNSQVLKLGIDKVVANLGFDAYQELLTNAVKGYKYHKIDLTKHRPENEIKQELKWLLR